MCESSLVIESLVQIQDALSRIIRRFSVISAPEDFTANDDNLDRLDAIAMMLIAIGENFKRIDKDTNFELLPQFPEVDWAGVKGIRDVLSHGYFDIDAEVIFQVCSEDISPLLTVVQVMLMRFDVPVSEATQ